MHLTDILVDPVESWLACEAWVNDGSPSGFSSKFRVPPAYAAESGEEFSLPWLRVPQHLALEVGEWPRQIDSSDAASFLPLHPVAMDVENYRPFEVDLVEHDSLRARATASGRTVAIAPTFDWQVKLHYPRVLGRVDRSLPFQKAVAGVENSYEIVSHLDSSEGELASWSILPEVAVRSVLMPGRYPSALVRSSHPHARLPEEVALVPAFSLPAQDSRETTTPDLLSQILRRFDDPFAELLRMLRLVVAGYSSLTFDLGIVPEVNAQNLLFSLDADGRVVRAVFRDLSRAERALHIRREKGLPLQRLATPYKEFDHQEDCRYAMTRHSFSLDFKLSQYVLAPLVDSCTRLIGAPDRSHDGHVKDLVFEVCGLGSRRNLFPAEGEYFAHERILLTGERPYVLRRDGRFR